MQEAKKISDPSLENIPSFDQLSTAGRPLDCGTGGWSGVNSRPRPVKQSLTVSNFMFIEKKKIGRQEIGIFVRQVRSAGEADLSNIKKKA